MGDTSTIYCALQSGDEYFAKREYFLAACEYRVAAYVYTCGDPYGFMPDSDPIRKFFKCFKKLKPDEQRKFWLVPYHTDKCTGCNITTDITSDIRSENNMRILIYIDANIISINRICLKE